MVSIDWLMLFAFGVSVADFLGDFEDGVTDTSLQAVGEREVTGIGRMMGKSCLRMEEIESCRQFARCIVARVTSPWSSCATQRQRRSLRPLQCAKTQIPRNSNQTES